MHSDELIKWLLQGDVAIQYQTYKYLLNDERPELQERIATEGWGKALLSARKDEGHWGDHFYQPKWISTHYTLLDLKNLEVSPKTKVIQESIQTVLDNQKADDGGIQLGPSTSHHSDVCVNAMFLNYAAYFECAEVDLRSIIDSLLNEMMPDGGFNCRSTRSGAVHSSLHSTISILEGFASYLSTGHQYKKEEVKQAQKSAEEFILIHRLFKSDKTGKIIHPDFIKLPYPSRWKYDILRALDYFQSVQHPWDERMQDALDVILSKRTKEGQWKLNAAYAGQVHIQMEKAGKPSRWNTLRALRVLNHFDKEY